MSSDVMSTVGVGVVLVINVVHVEVDVRTVVVNELKMPRSAGSSGKLSLRSLDVGLCQQICSNFNSENMKVPRSGAQQNSSLDFGSVVCRRLLDVQEMKHGPVRHVVDITSFTNGQQQLNQQ